MHPVRATRGEEKRGAHSDENRNKLHRKLQGLRNGIEAEIHTRASFAVSCLILGDGRLRPGNDVQNRKLSQRFRPQASSRRC